MTTLRATYTATHYVDIGVPANDTTSFRRTVPMSQEAAEKLAAEYNALEGEESIARVREVVRCPKCAAEMRGMSVAGLEGPNYKCPSCRYCSWTGTCAPEPKRTGRSMTWST